MDSIVTLKKGSALELNRKIMNDTIDVIYQLGHKKIVIEDGKVKMQELLHDYFFEGVDALNNENFKRLERHFDSLLFMTNSILEMIDTQKEPLYKTIVKMNQLLVSTKKLKENFIERQEMVQENREAVKRKIITPELLTFKAVTASKEQVSMKTEDVQKSHESINDLINEVLEQKMRLKKSVLSLNKSLEQVGFELRELDTPRQ